MKDYLSSITCSEPLYLSEEFYWNKTSIYTTDINMGKKQRQTEVSYIFFFMYFKEIIIFIMKLKNRWCHFPKS